VAIASAFQTIPSKVILAPLNWGLGHATRCMPIIQYLLENNCQVVLASDGNALEFLKKEFPNVKTYELPAYNILYKQKKIEHSMLLQAPKILKAILAENKQAKDIISQEKPDLIISDNRLGFRSDNVRSVYITHQIKLISQTQLFSQLGSKLHKNYIEKFDECWVPDIEGSILSGEMSTPEIKIKKRFLGCLSRLKKESTEVKKIYDCIAILSGPEPQRTKLQELLIPILSKRKKRTLLVRGVVEDRTVPEQEGNLELKNYMLTEELQKAIAHSEKIICRSGYSSVMDLQRLDRKAILIPTPGQSEQEYLAARANEQNRHLSLSQDNVTKELSKLLECE